MDRTDAGEGPNCPSYTALFRTCFDINFTDVASSKDLDAGASITYLWIPIHIQYSHYAKSGYFYASTYIHVYLPGSAVWAHHSTFIP